MGGNRFSMSDLTDAGCCGCFGFLRKHHRSVMPFRGSSAAFSSDYLLPHNPEDVDRSFYNRENPDDDPHDSESGSQQSVKRSEEIILARIQNGLICRDVPVKETRRLTISKVNQDLSFFLVCVHFVCCIDNCLLDCENYDSWSKRERRR